MMESNEIDICGSSGVKLRSRVWLQWQHLWGVAVWHYRGSIRAQRTPVGLTQLILVDQFQAATATEAQELQHISAETHAHKCIEEGIEAGVHVSQTLQHLSHNVETLHLLAVRHSHVGGLHRHHDQYAIVGQLGNDEHYHHNQYDAHGLVLLEVSGIEQLGNNDAVAERHDDEG